MSRSMWILLGVGVVLLLGIVVAAAVLQSGGKSSGSGEPTVYGQDPVGAPTTSYVTAFNWSGGGSGNDIRNSAPFALEGGHQIMSVQASAVTGEFANPSMSWYVKAADGREGMEMLNPASFGTSRADFYLPAGSYYISSNTLDCTWSLTLQEER